MVVLAGLVLVPSLFPAEKRLASPAVPRWLPLLAVFLALLFGLLAGGARGLTEERLREEEAKLFPARAAEAVAREAPPGPLFNHFNWGGYLIWKLPSYRVSMDGRTNLHGEERIERSLATWAGGKDWDKDPELREAGVVFAEAGTALTSLLRRDDRFQILYEDDQAVVFVRKRTN
jgi:hypothetical protein